MPRKKRVARNDSEDEFQEPPTKRRRTTKPRKRATVEESESDEEKESEMLDGDKFRVFQHETILVVEPAKCAGSEKIAGFDMDWTMVYPKSGRKFPTGRRDWVWQFDSVPGKLKELHADGYRIVIFTNQNGIGTGKQRASEITGKIQDLSKDLGIPLTGVLSTQKDFWRKPATLMWDFFVSDLNGGVEVDIGACYYVGDAAGRPKGWNGPKTKKDFSASDRKFAANIGIPFYTPEPFFEDAQPFGGWSWLAMNPQDAIDNAEAEMFEGTKPIHRDSLDVVLMVGWPGSGKSSFSKRYLVNHGYERVNRDTLKTPAKCLKAAVAALSRGKNVVVDNTNGNSGKREKYIAAAKSAGATVRCFWMSASNELAMHMNLFREKQTRGGVPRIPQVAFRVFNKHFEAPDTDEGFDEVCRINFAPEFDSDEDRTLFMHWT